MMPKLPPPDPNRWYAVEDVATYMRLAVEACAQACENEAFGDITAYDDACGDCAAAIRKLKEEIGK